MDEKDMEHLKEKFSICTDAELLQFIAVLRQWILEITALDEKDRETLSCKFEQYSWDDLVYVLKCLDRWGQPPEDWPRVFTTYKPDELLALCKYKCQEWGDDGPKRNHQGVGLV